MKWKNQLILNHLVPKLGPFRADDRGRRDEIPRQIFRGPAYLGTSWFQFIWFFHLWNHQNPPGFNLFLSSFMKPPPKPSRFQLIFLPSFMKPQMVSTFMAKNIRETTKNFKKNHETRSQKKMRGFSLIPCFVSHFRLQYSYFWTYLIFIYLHIYYLRPYFWQFWFWFAISQTYVMAILPGGNWRGQAGQIAFATQI